MTGWSWTASDGGGALGVSPGCQWSPMLVVMNTRRWHRSCQRLFAERAAWEDLRHAYAEVHQRPLICCSVEQVSGAKMPGPSQFYEQDFPRRITRQIFSCSLPQQGGRGAAGGGEREPHQVQVTVDMVCVWCCV